MESIDAILDFAIRNEEKAFELYTTLAGKSGNPSARKMFERLAQEEKGHKIKLERIREGDMTFSEPGKPVADLGIAETLEEVPRDGELDFQKALIYAMQAEKRAYQLYTTLAGLAEDNELRKLFESLAREEAGHKLRIEIEYDDGIYRDN
ncbi:ferritin family protein [bacterium]|nr:ferritin family protein [bacterium]